MSAQSTSYIDLSQAALRARYPLLARNVGNRDSMWPFESEGVACDPGWSALIARVFDEIETAIAGQKQSGVPEKKWPLVEQVKQKFGELCIYISNSTTAIDAAILYATQRSRLTCAVCAQPGVKRVIGGWQLATVCDEHAREK